VHRETLGRLVRAGALLIALSPLGVGAQPPNQSASSQPVTIRFRTTVGDTPFTCQQSYPGLGSASTTMSVSDLRFFVHDVRLLTASGSEVPVALATHSLWQSNGVALLDFENGRGSCSNGTPELRDIVVGSAPEGQYTGVRFTVGVPFELNHRDLTQQASPLSLSRMFWAWNSGYKFMRIDMKAEGGAGWVLHLGSTECQPTGSPSTIPTRCAWANRPTITVDQFDPSRDAVRLDLAALFKTANLTVNEPKTAMGCMSGQADSDCAPVFAALGLPFGTTTAGQQSAFRLDRVASADGAAR
jgi:uncharacterized repeat protein (TIGR04052 family)